MIHLVREALLESAYGTSARPFSVLVQRLRSQGAPITESVLARTLRAPDSGVRLVRPWSGEMAPLRDFFPRDETASDEDANQEVWVVLSEMNGDDPPDPDTPAGLCLRRTLSHLGTTLDQDSPGDVARWLAMVEEARRLRRAA